MDCNLDEVSGQMMLPLPILAPPTEVPTATSSAVLRIARRVSPSRPLSGLSIFHRISNTARRLSAPRLGWSPARFGFVVARYGVSSQRSIAR